MLTRLAGAARLTSLTRGTFLTFVSNQTKLCLGRHASSLSAGKTIKYHEQKNTKTSTVGLDFRIVKHERTHEFESNAVQDNIIELDDIEIQVNKHRLLLNVTWLRDSCHCSECTHQYSRQRLINVKDFDANWFRLDSIKYVQPTKTSHLNVDQPQLQGPDHHGHLRVRWANGHESTYSIGWLQRVHHIAEAQKHNPITRSHKRSKRVSIELPEDDFYLAKPKNRIDPVFWDVETINSNLTPIDYNQLIEGFSFDTAKGATHINANDMISMTSGRFESLLNLTRRLVRFGLAKIVNVPQERDKLLTVARSMAYDRPTGYGTAFDVVVEPSEDINLAYSSLEFDLHSDLTYRETSPGVQLLHCIKNSIDGGYSYFSDAYKAATQLSESDPILFQVLSEFPASFLCRDPYRDVKFRRQKPVISFDAQGNLEDIYYGPFMMPPIGSLKDVKLFYLAMYQFTKYLQSPSNKLISKMAPGELFIFHNRRVLHGRSAYDARKSSRFLQGCYMDWDEINSLNEKLELHNNSL